jgi:hypothetical protein
LDDNRNIKFTEPLAMEFRGDLVRTFDEKVDQRLKEAAGRIVRWSDTAK